MRLREEPFDHQPGYGHDEAGQEHEKRFAAKQDVVQRKRELFTEDKEFDRKNKSA